MSKKDKEAVESEETPASPKSKKKKIIMIAIVVVLLGGAGLAAKTMLFSGDSAPPPPVAGLVTSLDAVTVNLASGHYLKLKLALQATDAVAEELDGSHAIDIAIAQLSDKDMSELSSAAGRKKAKAELLKEVKEAYDGEVMDIYFTEFVMQ
jgi:flagellar FliL protein